MWATVFLCSKLCPLLCFSSIDFDFCIELLLDWVFSVEYAFEWSSDPDFYPVLLFVDKRSQFGVVVC